MQQIRGSELQEGHLLILDNGLRLARIVATIPHGDQAIFVKVSDGSGLTFRADDLVVVLVTYETQAGWLKDGQTLLLDGSILASIYGIYPGQDGSFFAELSGGHGRHFQSDDLVPVVHEPG